MASEAPVVADVCSDLLWPPSIGGPNASGSEAGEERRSSLRFFSEGVRINLNTCHKAGLSGIVIADGLARASQWVSCSSGAGLRVLCIASRLCMIDGLIGPLVFQSPPFGRVVAWHRQAKLPTYMSVTGAWNITENWSVQAAAIEPPEAEQPKKSSAKKRVRKVKLPWELFGAMDGPSKWYTPPASRARAPAAGASFGPESHVTPKKQHCSEGDQGDGSGDEGQPSGEPGAEGAPDGPFEESTSEASSASAASGSIPDKPPPRVSPAKLASLMKQAKELSK